MARPVDSSGPPPGSLLTCRLYVTIPLKEVTEPEVELEDVRRTVGGWFGDIIPPHSIDPFEDEDDPKLVHGCEVFMKDVRSVHASS